MLIQAAHDIALQPSSIHEELPVDVEGAEDTSSINEASISCLFNPNQITHKSQTPRSPWPFRWNHEHAGSLFARLW
jgi:hypothetical protein